MGVGCQPHAPATSTPRKDPVPIVQEKGWAPGPVWTGAENLAPTGIRSPDRLARSQSLYRLNYRSHFILSTFAENDAISTRRKCRNFFCLRHRCVSACYKMVSYLRHQPN